MRAFPLLAAISLSASLSLAGCATRSSLLVSPDFTPDCKDAPRLERPLVVANYNIKSGSWSSLDVVGRVLDELDADVLALQEVDHLMARSGRVDQSEVLARRLGMKRIFAGALERDGGTYGVALLTRLPVRSAQRFDLPWAGGAEPRVAIDAELCTRGGPLRVLTGHHDFTPWAADAQARALARHIGDDDDVLILGDFNMTPDTEGIRALLRRPLVKRPLVDALGRFAEGPTFEGVGRIDYILTDHPVTGADILKRRASDHFPVRASLDLIERVTDAVAGRER